MRSYSHFEEASRDVLLQVVALEAANLRAVTAVALSSPTLYKMFIGDKLLLDFACGNIVAAENILKQNPQLLFYKGTVKDHSGHTLINVTPLEVGYGADHADICQMTLPYLNQIEHGREKALELLERRFFANPTYKAYDFAELVAVFMNQDNVALMKEAAYEFQHLFKPGTVCKGKPFDVRILIDAMNACALVIKSDPGFLGQHNFLRQRLFWQLIVGWLERRIPDHYAKLICADFKKLSIGKGLLKNPYDLAYGDVFYPLDVRSDRRLGSDYGVLATGDRRRGVATVAANSVGATGSELNKDLRGFINKLQEAYNENQLGLANFITLLRQPAPIAGAENNEDQSSSCTIL